MVLDGHRLRIVTAEHSRQPVGRFEVLEIAIAEEIEQRAVEIQRLGVARDQDADRQPIQKRSRVAAGYLLEPRANAFGKRRPGKRGVGRLGGTALLFGHRRGRFRLPILAQGLRAAHQRPGDFPEGVPLASAEFDAVSGPLGIARRRRVGGPRADRNDLRRASGGLAQEIDLRGTLLMRSRQSRVRICAF